MSNKYQTALWTRKLYLSKFIFINSFNNIYLSIITSYLGACDCRISKRCWLEYEPGFFLGGFTTMGLFEAYRAKQTDYWKTQLWEFQISSRKKFTNNWPSFLVSSCTLLLLLCISSLLWLWYLNGKKSLWEFWEPPLMELVTGNVRGTARESEFGISAIDVRRRPCRRRGAWK